MVKLLDPDIKTREVLGWKGVHLLHAPFSSCSQKTRIFLNLKNIPWESHLVNLGAGENHEPWYLGVNPRGLVPCLVHDGSVHIESNDIIEHLEAAFPEPALIPQAHRDRMKDLLKMEDDLHLDLRVLSFRYIIPTPPGMMKNSQALANFQDHDGTIQGAADPHKAEELEFWAAANEHGITDAQVLEAVGKFHQAFERLEETLSRSAYALGEELSILDIAWYVYGARVSLAGYRLEQHPNLWRWYNGLDARAEFHDEVQPPDGLRAGITAKQEAIVNAKQTLPDLLARASTPSTA